MYYFYEILTVFRKLKIMSEVVLLLRNTDHLWQVECCVRDCYTSIKYWPPSTSSRIYQRLFYFYQILTAFNKLQDYVRDCSTSAKYWSPSRRVWRYKRSNQNPYIEEEQTTQWPKEKVQKDKQRSTKHTHKTKDRVTRTPLKTVAELWCSGRISSSCSTSGIRRVNLVTDPVISREWGKDREVFTTNGTYPWSFVTHIFHSGQPSHGGDHNIQGNHNRNHKLWNIASIERYILHMQVLLECCYI
jgi:hypothetical protein